MTVFSGIVFFTTTQSKSRPSRLVKKWGIRYTDNSCFSEQEIQSVVDDCFHYWNQHLNPRSISKINKALKNLNIFWTPERIQYQDQLLAGFTPSLEEMQLWTGPMLPDKTRKIIYTALEDQLIQWSEIITGKSMKLVKLDLTANRVITSGKEKPLSLDQIVLD